MKNYKITVNGNVYDVQVEEINAANTAVKAAAPTQAAVPAAQAAPTPTPAPTQAAASVPAGKGTSVPAPMPGTVLDIKVNVGDKVNANQVVAVLEAMKMENDIVTPVSGTVTAVNATKGQTVNSGDALITVAE